MPRTSTLTEPFFDHRPLGYPSHLPPLKLMSVDILPTALPYDASDAFSESLLPFLRSKISEYKATLSRHVPAKDAFTSSLQDATVAEGGQLTPSFHHLKDLVKEHGLAEIRQSTRSPTKPPGTPENILLLGSGMVAAPLVDHLCRRTDIQLLVGT